MQQDYRLGNVVVAGSSKPAVRRRQGWTGTPTSCRSCVAAPTAAPTADQKLRLTVTAHSRGRPGWPTA